MVLAFLVVLVAVAPSPARSAPDDVTMFALPAGASPNSVVGGPDGNVWYADGRDVIGKISPAGTVTEFVVNPNSFYAPYDLVLGPDGNLWFTVIFGGKIGRISPAGTITEFFVGGQPTGITVGPDGDLWFADMGLNAVRAISTMGVERPFWLAGGLNNPRELTTGADGNVWVTEYNSHAITRITPQRFTTRFALLPFGLFSPTGVATVPDGNVWFSTSGSIGRITPTSDHGVRASLARSLAVRHHKRSRREPLVHREEHQQDWASNSDGGVH